MAIEHPTPSERRRSDPRDSTSAPRASTPSRTDIGRFTARAREEMAGRRLHGDSSRTVARCPACGAAVRGGDDYVRSRGDLYHPECMLYRRAARTEDGRS